MKRKTLCKFTQITGSLLCILSHICYAQDSEEETQPDQPTAQLPTLVVLSQDSLSSGQVSKSSQIGILGNRATQDIPFSVTTYTAKYINDKQAKNIAEALESDPTVRNIFTPNGIGQYFNIRGFYTQSHEFAWDGLFGLLPHNRVPTEFFDRIEVFRGTSAMLNGMSLGSAIGGVINVSPKRAASEPLTRLTTTYSSDFNMGAHIDVARRFGNNKQFGIRVNGLKSHGDTSLDDQTEDRRLGSLALDYKGKKLSASLDIYDIKEKLNHAMPFRTNFATTVIPKAPDASINTIPGSYAHSETTGIIAKLEYNLWKDWHTYFTIGNKDQKSHGYIASNATGMNLTPEGDYTARSMQHVNQTEVDAAEAGIRGQFNTGSIAHQLVLSGNHIDQEQSAIAGGYVDWASNIHNPTEPPSLAQLPSNIYKTSETTLSSVALADILSILDNRYQLILGLRLQRVETTSFNATGAISGMEYDENALTPAVGIVIKPLKNKNISVYANYIEGLSEGNTVTDSSADNYNEMFAPYKSEQYELGLKWETQLFRNTLSIYQISKPSMIKNTATNTYQDDGEQRNRGIEWTVAGEVLPNLRLLGGVVYMDAELTKTASGTYNGKQAIGIPNYQSNLGLEWDVKPLNGLTLSINSIYNGSVYADNANTQEVPSWTRIDLAARYATILASKNVVFRAGVDNVFDKQYWSGVWYGYASVGLPRSYKFSMQFDF